MDAVERCDGKVPSVVFCVRGHRCGCHIQTCELQALCRLLEHDNAAPAQLNRYPPSHGRRGPVDFLENEGGYETLPAISSQPVEDPQGCEETIGQIGIAERAEDGSVEIDPGLHARSRAFCRRPWEEARAIEPKLAVAGFAAQCPQLETPAGIDKAWERGETWAVDPELISSKRRELEEATADFCRHIDEVGESLRGELRVVAVEMARYWESVDRRIDHEERRLDRLDGRISTLETRTSNLKAGRKPRRPRRR